MKRINSLLIFSLLCIYMQSQELFEALALSESPNNGTARSVAMGGAFGALGGDPSVLSNNPAGLGIYRYSEFSLTLENAFATGKGIWGAETNTSRRNEFSVGQFAYIKTKLKENNTILLASNFGFSYNRLKNFQRVSDLRGNAKKSSLTDYIANMTNGVPETSLIESSNPYENEQIGWLSVLGYNALLIQPETGNNWRSLNNVLTTPSYRRSEHGSIDEINFSYGANLKHIVYLGASLSFQMMTYGINTSYGEDFENGEAFSLNNDYSLSGLGWNLKIGAIARPASFLRLGFAYHTPTFYSLSQSSTAKINSYGVTNHKNELVDISSSPGESSDSYYVYTPSRFLMSAGFIIGKKALIDLEYELIDYRSMNFGTKGLGNFNTQNKYIDNNAKLSHIVKLGAEYRILEFLSLRIGGGIATPSVKQDAEKILSYNTMRTDTEYYTDKGSYYAGGGLGFRIGNWAIDIAYQFHQKIESFKAFANTDTGNTATLHTNTHHALATCSYRF